MSTFFLLVSIAAMLFLMITLVEFQIGFKKIINLDSIAPISSQALPKISIIFSALNEEENIAKALQSLLQLDYANYEIIAINDRSTDNTPIILNEMAQQYEHLNVLHIQDLPAGWIGKNHALHQGAQIATGDWLLFTDADVEMQPLTLSKAMAYVSEHSVDHLTLHENHRAGQLGLKIFLLANYFHQTLFMKPWTLRHKTRGASFGNGAFNLVRQPVYQSIGGHQQIAMQCLDDLHLGKLVKKHQWRQDLVDGQDLVARQWYKTLFEMMHGLRKNSFAFFNYSLLIAGGAVVFIALFYVLPLVLVFKTTGILQCIALSNIVLTVSLNRMIAKQFRLNPNIAWCYPLSVLFLAITIFNSIIATYRNRGVIWRGTLYSLKELKAR